MDNKEILEQIKGGLIVSCQACKDEPFYGNVDKFAISAAQSGAVAIRANTTGDINAICQAVDLPVIGLIKREYGDNPCYITPTMQEVDEIAMNTEAAIIAVDATNRNHPDGKTGAEFIAEIKQKYPNKLLMADVSIYSEGIEAQNAGADMVSTTLSGYTSYSPQISTPDFELIEKLAKSLNIPLIAEGRIWTPEEFRRAYSLGSYSVVIGSAITRPHQITKRFIEAIA